MYTMCNTSTDSIQLEFGRDNVATLASASPCHCVVVVVVFVFVDGVIMATA
jgi:hypothetical protein